MLLLLEPAMAAPALGGCARRTPCSEVRAAAVDTARAVAGLVPGVSGGVGVVVEQRPSGSNAAPAGGAVDADLGSIFIFSWDWVCGRWGC